MEKLKHAVSHRHRKSTDAAHDRHHSPTTAEPVSHPIYDQFTSTAASASGEPTKTTDNPPRFSNKAHLTPPRPHSQSPQPDTSTLQPSSPTYPSGEDTSAVSIKSGVIGFPKGPQDTHAALAHRALSSSTSGISGDHPSQSGTDATLGPSTAGAGALADPELQSKPGDTIHDSTPTMREDSSSTGRAFPLSGGVTERRPVEAENAYTNERGLGSQEKELTSREALAGAAAAATAAGSSSAPYDPDNHGHDRTFSGDPCGSGFGEDQRTADTSGLLFTSGPHRTDTANRLDPKLHIPGEYPSPTPIEEPSAPSYLESKPVPTVPSDVAQPELRHTGTLDEPRRRSADLEHHHGRDAAVAGGLGAASLGAYEASKHHHPSSREEPASTKEASSTSGPIFPAEVNPYTSSKLDPRVDGTPSSYDNQRFDPSASETHGRRNVAVGSGLVDASKPAVQETPREYPALAQYPSPAARQQQQQQQQQDHHPHLSARDAALASAGASTTAALYASQRAAEPASTGPASATIGPHQRNLANVLDPRVQPDPAVQKHHYAAPTVEDPAPATLGPHRSDVINVLDPRVRPEPGKMKAAPKREGLEVASDPVQQQQEQQQEHHHYGRDAAMGFGVGAGAAGAGAYIAGSQGGDVDAEGRAGHQRWDSVQDPGVKQNTSVAGAAAGSAAPAASASAYQHDKQASQEREFEAQRKALRDGKKELNHQQKEHDKAAAAAAAAEEEEEKKKSKKKKHRFSFLHRDRDGKERRSLEGSASGSEASSPRRSEDVDLASGALAAGGGGIGMGQEVGASGSEDGSEGLVRGKSGRRRLHKDPPKGHPAREALEHRREGEGGRVHMGTDGRIGDPDAVSEPN